MENNEASEAINNMINNLDQSKNAVIDNINKVAVESESIPEKEQLKEEVLLFDQIVSTIKNTLSDKMTVDMLSTLCEKLNVNISQELVGLLYTSVVYSVYDAIGLYDDALKGSLQGDFQAISELIATLDSEIAVLKMKMADIEKFLMLNHQYKPASQMGNLNNNVTN